MTANAPTETLQKVWTLPRRHFEAALGVPAGWRVTEVHVDVGEIKVVALPDKAVA